MARRPKTGTSQTTRQQLTETKTIAGHLKCVPPFVLASDGTATQDYLTLSLACGTKNAGRNGKGETKTATAEK